MAHHIRPATPDDAPALLHVYTPYVEETAVTFETEPPTEAEFRRRIESLLAAYPYLVCQRGGAVVGYAYASPHRTRAAYRYSAEVSVYLHRDFRGLGLGSALYAALLPRLADLGYASAYAGITLPNDASRRLHEKHGFREIGVFHRVGYKLGAWHNVLWMETHLQDESFVPSGMGSSS